MGREVRMVPPHWDHPSKEEYNPFRQRSETRKQPMHDETFEDAAAGWKAEFAKWEAGERPSYCSEPELEFWEYDSGPPDREYYRPWQDEEATWFQVWETVSEGTPVTPPFATKDELVAYLVANGDEWDQSRDDGGWSRANAESFVGSGYAPSMIVIQSEAGAEIFAPRDGMPA